MRNLTVGDEIHSMHTMTKTSSEIRRLFLDFFRKNQHRRLSGASVVSRQDSSLLFVNAGMNQFKDAFLDAGNVRHRRVVTSQMCLRVGGKHNDLNNVGHTPFHHTLFEMLGNFSFGDYFKREAIEFAWEFLIGSQGLKIPPEKLWVTVHSNDRESCNIWRNTIRISPQRIVEIGNSSNPIASDNFWKMGSTGPCGFCSEIFYDKGEDFSGRIDEDKKTTNARYIEIWNLVFVQFNLQPNGILRSLPHASVDTGMGLERVASALQLVDSVYQTDVFDRLIEKISKILNVDHPVSSLRILADHVRSCLFLIGEGVSPSNEKHGYVLRKLIRRAFLAGKRAEVSGVFLHRLVSSVTKIMNDTLDGWNRKPFDMEKIIRTEEEQFFRILQHGSRLLERYLAKSRTFVLDGKTAFFLHDTHGLPWEVIQEICRSKGVDVDRRSFEKRMKIQKTRKNDKKHRISSDRLPMSNVTQIEATRRCKSDSFQSTIVCLLRQSKRTKRIIFEQQAWVVLEQSSFYAESAGQCGDCGCLETQNGVFRVTNTIKHERVVMHVGVVLSGFFCDGDVVRAKIDRVHRRCVSSNHSASHLLHSALRSVLNVCVEQKGSCIRKQSFRFDFTPCVLLQSDTMLRVENWVNHAVRANLPIRTESMKFTEAKFRNCAYLPHKTYPDFVTIVRMGDVSCELCQGTHVGRTGDIGAFVVTRVCSTESGVCRIEATTGKYALRLMQHNRKLLDDVRLLFHSNPHNLLDTLHRFKRQVRMLKKNDSLRKKEEIVRRFLWLRKKIKRIVHANVLVRHLEHSSPKVLHVLTHFFEKYDKVSLVCLSSEVKKKIIVVLRVNKKCAFLLPAKKFLKKITHNSREQLRGNTVRAEAIIHDTSKFFDCFPRIRQHAARVLSNANGAS